MRKTKIKPLSLAAFKEYGSYEIVINPTRRASGENGKEAFLDMISLEMGANNKPSVSVCRVQKRDLVVDAMEYHNNSSEGILPLDGDILIHVAHASSPAKPAFDQIEAFHVPKGTFVTLHPGVWHGWPFAFECEQVNVLIILPSRAWVTDCTIVDIPKNEQTQIVGVL